MPNVELLAPLGAESFRTETADVVARLRSTLTEMVSAVSGRPLTKSRDAQKLFNVDVKLSWQLFRTLSAGDPFDVIGHIPPRASFSKLLREARRKSVGGPLIDAAERAYHEFDQLVERHAGDRASFHRLLEGDSGSNFSELTNREAIFNASRQIWGTQMDVNLMVTFLHPAAGGDPRKNIEMISLAALRGFCRWRTEAPVLLFKHRLFSETKSRPDYHARPLDPETFERLGVPLLERFCSNPRPKLRTRRADDSLILTELDSAAVGRLNNVDVTQGQFFPSVSLMERPGGRLGWQMRRINATPTRVAINDWIVHRPTFGLLSWETGRWGNINTFPKTLEELDQSPDVPRLPKVDKIVFLGNAAYAARNTEVANYPEMLEFACKSRGWEIDEMDVYRHRSEFPLQSTMDAATFSIVNSENWPRESEAADRTEALEDKN